MGTGGAGGTPCVRDLGPSQTTEAAETETWHDDASAEGKSGARKLMLLLMLRFTISGILLALLSIPLILGNVGPNALYGFRVQKTLEDPAVWYPANSYAARRLLVVGLGGSVLAVALYFVPEMDVNTYALSCAGATLGGLAVTLIQSFLFLQQLPPRS